MTRKTQRACSTAAPALLLFGAAVAGSGCLHAHSDDHVTDSDAAAGDDGRAGAPYRGALDADSSTAGDTGQVADTREPTDTGAGGSGGVAVAGLWQPASAGNSIPVGAFPGGQESATTFYICRAPYGGGVHGGKAFPMGDCNFAYSGAEIMGATFEVLVGALYSWRSIRGPLTTIPDQAVPSGHDACGGPQYVCRASYMVGIHPGKLTNGHCSIGYGGNEIALDAFDLLLSGP